jgi:hypothetical protein
MSHILTSIKYKEHPWLLCGDMKVIMLLLGLQGGFAKYCCGLFNDTLSSSDYIVSYDGMINES